MRRQPYQRPEEGQPTWEDLGKSGLGCWDSRYKGPEDKEGLVCWQKEPKLSKRRRGWRQGRLRMGRPWGCAATGVSL